MESHRDDNSLSNETPNNDSVFLNGSQMSPHEISIGVQKSYKDLIRKLERKERYGMSQAGFDAGASSIDCSQMSISENNAMKELLNEAHDLYQNVQGPHEARLDARVLKHVSKICRLKSQDLSTNQQQFKVHNIRISKGRGRCVFSIKP